ncbi:hypothetical protein BSLA_03f1466 [Burkholderia stabilis]|nr:hypothetical protein BSLA_03f1466 [Burkholderia stabilis]
MRRTSREDRGHSRIARVGRRFPDAPRSQSAAGIVEFVVHSSISCLPDIGPRHPGISVSCSEYSTNEW